MSIKQLTNDDLLRFLREAGGEGESFELNGGMNELTFAELGYDSIAVLEVGGYIERECGLKLEDDVLTPTTTPRTLIAVVNGQLVEKG